MYDHAFLVFIKLRIINTACLVTGQVYSLGRKEYGRLGHGEENLEEKSEPTVIEELKGKKCEQISAGTATSFAIDEDGKLSVALSVALSEYLYYIEARQLLKISTLKDQGHLKVEVKVTQ